MKFIRFIPKFVNTMLIFLKPVYFGDHYMIEVKYNMSYYYENH